MANLNSNYFSDEKGLVCLWVAIVTHHHRALLLDPISIYRLYFSLDLIQIRFIPYTVLLPNHISSYVDENISTQAPPIAFTRLGGVFLRSIKIN